MMEPVEAELRCGRCTGRRPALLATIEGDRILVPVRISAHKARAVGVARGGMWWRPPAEDHGDVILRCRRCQTLSRVSRRSLVGAARTARVLYVSASTLTMASAAR